MRRAIVLLATWILVSCAAPAAVPDLSPTVTVTAAADAALVGQIDAALAKGSAYLIAQQQEDGSWRSAAYAAFRDGYSLTPVILKALAYSRADPRTAEVYRRGTAFLGTMVGADGKVVHLNYPVYSLSLSVVALALATEPRELSLRARLVEELRRYQLVEANGWSEADVSYGGWGYWHAVPARPAGDRPLDELLSSNLPATLAAVGALRLAGVPADDPALAKARRFVERCQNRAKDPEAADPAWDDGGFFFTPANELQNKAMGGVDRHGAARLRSYGTMTADGVRALLRAGVAPTDPRVRDAASWLARRFDPTTPPGEYPELRKVQQSSVRYYWAWTVAHAFRALGDREVEVDGKKLRWGEALARALLAARRAAGSWANAATDMREDDPLVATPMALAGLGLARAALAP